MINHKIGDITQLEDSIIVHCVNTDGVMGAGVALALLNKWPQVKLCYQDWFGTRTSVQFLCKHVEFRSSHRPTLGDIEMVRCDTNLVVNLVGQKSTGGLHLKHVQSIWPYRNEALREGFLRLISWYKETNEQRPICTPSIVTGKQD